MFQLTLISIPIAKHYVITQILNKNRVLNLNRFALQYSFTLSQLEVRIIPWVCRWCGDWVGWVTASGFCHPGFESRFTFVIVRSCCWKLITCITLIWNWSLLENQIWKENNGAITNVDENDLKKFPIESFDRKKGRCFRSLMKCAATNPYPGRRNSTAYQSAAAKSTKATCETSSKWPKILNVKHTLGIGRHVCLKVTFPFSNF